MHTAVYLSDVFPYKVCEKINSILQHADTIHLKQSDRRFESLKNDIECNS